MKKNYGKLKIRCQNYLEYYQDGDESCKNTSMNRISLSRCMVSTFNFNLQLQPSTFNFNLQHSTSTFNIQPSTFNLQQLIIIL